MFARFAIPPRCIRVFLLSVFLFSCPFYSGCGRFSVQQQLENYAAQQKQEKKVPRKISDNQMLIDITTGERELIQVFTVKGPLQKIRGQLPELEKNVLTQLKKNKQQIQNLVDYKIVMTFRYLHEPTRELIHEFKVKPWSDL